MDLAILLFVKLPQPGQVKTRLAAEVGAPEAAKIYEELVAAVLTHRVTLRPNIITHMQHWESLVLAEVVFTDPAMREKIGREYTVLLVMSKGLKLPLVVCLGSAGDPCMH